MEILDEKSKSKIGFAELYSSEKHHESNFTGPLIGFFSLTKEERLRAGIYIGNEGREWLNRSALIIPHDDESN
ncbi:MAG: hypothetical protein AB2L18_03585 [Anaerolineaceae bacterium]